MASSRDLQIVLFALLAVEGCFSTSLKPDGCPVGHNMLPDGTLRLHKHALTDDVFTSIKENFKIQFQCTTPGYEMYVDGQLHGENTEYKVCKDGTLQGPDIECRPNKMKVCNDSFYLPETSPKAQVNAIPVGLCAHVQCDCEKIFAPSLLQRNIVPVKCYGMANHRQLVKLACSREGMVLKQTGVIQCMYGEWVYPEDKDVYCVPGMGTCTVPDIENALFHIDSKQVYPGHTVSHGTINEIACDDGYSPAHMSSIHPEKLLTNCDNGHWSHKDVSCVPAQCWCEQLRNRGLLQRFVVPDSCSGKVNHGQAIGLKCERLNMALQQEGFIKCEFGQWIYPSDENVRCEQSASNCIVPNIPRAIFHAYTNRVYGGQTVGHGKVSEVTCEDGYSPSLKSSIQSGKLEVSCRDGKWSHEEISCVAAQCDCDHIYSSDMLRRYLKEGPCNNVVRHGQRVRVECRYAESILRKEGFIECQFGKWLYPQDREVRCDRIIRSQSCIVPDITNAIFLHNSRKVFDGQSIDHNETVEVVCEHGYSPSLLSEIQEKILTSCDDGQWSRDKISCVPAQCNCQGISTHWMTERYLEIGSECNGRINHGKTVDISCRHSATTLSKRGFITCEYGAWQYPKDENIRCIPRPCLLKPSQFHNARLYIGNKDVTETHEEVDVRHGVSIRIECISNEYELYKDGIPLQEPGEVFVRPKIICFSGVLKGRRTECRPEKQDQEVEAELTRSS